MRSRHWLWLMAAALLLGGATTGCDDPPPKPAPVVQPAPSAKPAPSAAPSVKVKSKCEVLSDAVWKAVTTLPKHCVTTDDCAIVGPAACKVGKQMKSCTAAIAKGGEAKIDKLSKKWEDAGCEKGLDEVRDEQLKCKAGRCVMVFDRTGGED